MQRPGRPWHQPDHLRHFFFFLQIVHSHYSFVYIRNLEVNMSVIMATVTLGLRISSKKVERVVLKDINLSDKVEIIRQEASKRTNTAPEKIELIHCGVRLKGNESLQDAGITSGAIIHCLPKKGSPTAPVPVPVGISEVQQLLLSLRTLVGNAQFRPFIQKLKTPEMVEKVMVACPEVQRDPMALALMQDPELVLGLVNPDHLSNVVEEHPAVAQVIHHVCGLVSCQSSSQRSHHVSYSMDALSDDEQMEEGGEWQTGSASSNNSSLPPITPAQLAAALASAAGNGSSTSSSSRTSRNGGTSLASTSAPPSQPPPEAGPITAQMFSQALQNALAASASRTASSTPFMGTSQASGSPGAASAPIPNLDESLQLMREMGIPDEELSKQALQATNGDVQAAVNLIFAQWMADDDNM